MAQETLRLDFGYDTGGRQTGLPLGNINFDTITPSIEQWQSDAIDYLYQVEPRSQNLFMACGFREAGGPMPGPVVRPFYNFAYRVRAIDIQMPTIDYEIDKLSRLPIPKSVNYPQEVGITYFEDVYHSVRGLHTAWWQRWYSRELDMWRCGQQGKFRSIRLIAFHYVNDQSLQASVIEVPKVQPLFVIDIQGMTPKDLGGSWKFDYSSDGNEGLITFNYKISKMNFLYNSQFSKTNANISATVSDELKTYTKNSSVWTPVGFQQDGFVGADTSGVSLEAVRLIRSTTSSMHSDVAIG